MKFDLHQSITDSIIAAIEKGQGNFTMPWIRNQSMPSKIDGSPYRGINVLILWIQAEMFGYATGQWGGFRAWGEQGGKVRKGEKATQIIFYKVLEVEKTKGEITQLPMIRYFNVWNRDQVDGLPEIQQPEGLTDRTGDASRAVHAIAEKNNASVLVSGQKAFYRPATDTITMPMPELFIDRAGISADVSYASTLSHELIHWTGAADRLNRISDERVKKEYAFEELVAELGAAFICGELNFEYNGVADHAGYIESWLRNLREDKKAIFRAASLASSATAFLTDPVEAVQ